MGAAPVSVRILVRPFLRFVSTLVIAVGVVTCSDSPPAPVGHTRGTEARVQLEPVFSKSAADASGRLADFGIGYDRVRVVLSRAIADTVRDTTIAFAPGQPELTLDLTVDVHASDEVLDVSIDYLSTTGVVFHGHGRAHARSPDGASPLQQDPITIEYVGPGANVSRIEVSPKTLTVLADHVASLAVRAFDAGNRLVPTVPLSWATSDNAVATIARDGSLRAAGRRGAVTISVVTPTGVADSAAAKIVLPPAAIVVANGAGQKGRVGKVLPARVVVQVNAVDGVGVADVEVVFSPPPGGGVAAASVTTDANGRASASLTLGTLAGPQSFSASAAGFSVSIPETAIAGDPKSIAIVSGNGQSDIVRKVLAPLIVLVADEFGNPVSDATVEWARTAGAGALAATTSITAADGRASMVYTLGNVVGTESVTASVAGVANPASFSFRALAAGPTHIAIVSGSGQTAVVNTQLAAPFVARVTDDAGNPVGGATVGWTAVNGTIAAASVSDATGRTSAVMTLGSRAGSASANATIANGQRVTFSATAQPGPVALLAFSTQPSNTLAGVPLSPVRVRLTDADGNQTTATNAVSIALGNNPSAAQMAGTLVRNAVLGVATFDDLRVDKLGSGYTLLATSGNMAPVASSPFDVTAGSPAARFVVVAGDDQHVTVASTVPIAPSVRVLDGKGDPVAGVPVTFTPADGSGTVTPSGPVTTNSSGVATLTSWTLGTHAGPQSLVVSSPGIESVSIEASAHADGPVKLAIVTQPSTTAISDALLARQPVIQVQDQYGNPVTASDLTIVATVSSGTLQGTTSVVPDPATGLAKFIDLRILGAGTVTLSFAAQGIPAVTSNAIVVSTQ